MNISKMDLIKQIMNMEGDTVSSEDLAKIAGIDSPNTREETLEVNSGEAVLKEIVERQNFDDVEQGELDSEDLAKIADIEYTKTQILLL